MKKIKLLCYCLLFLGAIAACKSDVHSPITADGLAPKPVSNAQVKNLSGGAIISYALPDDANLLYVKAVYTLNGVQQEAKASFYQKSITVQGFGDTLQRDVTLYAVSRSEQVSSPVVVKVSPLTPPVKKVAVSLNPQASFGGFNCAFANPDSANVAIFSLLYDEQQRTWKQLDGYYTSLPSGNFSIRGLNPVLQKFALVVRDHWGNKSDTLKFSLTPVYEVKLDKTKFADMRKKYPIPQIAPLPLSGVAMKEAVDYSSSYPIKNLYDDNTTSMFHTKQNVDQPIWIPIDLGVKARLSRYILWQRVGGFEFNHGNPHEWELWGTNNPADVNSWVLLDHEVMIKPSGSPLGVNTTDDTFIATSGQEYQFPSNIPAVRYVAWKNIDCWASPQGMTGFFHLFELSVYGQVQP
ncbi:DUF4959 domain-containing protein [Mucilaginibacter mali]|uniref:DUF4959 domain-containing protein n=1 Tax=Mucilaginibacter mali TaxID=2740462 RepID=A0A7D4QAS5_9SPHI|nr:DUF5000 domain-containing lipoprotein [Mucilaginibacter mali]QKJ31045.1 DUF4959 domain-containing protein [Mucilaginibacter mali]